MSMPCGTNGHEASACAKVAKHGLQTINGLDAYHFHEDFAPLANAESVPAVPDCGNLPDVVLDGWRLASGCARTITDLAENWNREAETGERAPPHSITSSAGGPSPAGNS
jgi:hypothetical protein